MLTSSRHYDCCETHSQQSQPTVVHNLKVPILAKTRNRMTTAITFCSQNDAGSLTNEQYSVLRKSRTRSRSRLRIVSKEDDYFSHIASYETIDGSYCLKKGNMITSTNNLVLSSTR